jgi:hypothetical protein
MSAEQILSLMKRRARESSGRGFSGGGSTGGGRTGGGSTGGLLTPKAQKGLQAYQLFRDKHPGLDRATLSALWQQHKAKKGMGGRAPASRAKSGRGLVGGFKGQRAAEMRILADELQKGLSQHKAEKNAWKQINTLRIAEDEEPRKMFVSSAMKAKRGATPSALLKKAAAAERKADRLQERAQVAQGKSVPTTIAGLQRLVVSQRKKLDLCASTKKPSSMAEGDYGRMLRSVAARQLAALEEMEAQESIRG